MSQVILQNKIQKDYSTFKAIVDDTLTEVTADMLDGITTISGSAFLNCSVLTTVEIPDSVTTIGNLAFNDCRSLRNIKIPSSVTTIGNSVFANCYSLTSVEIPNSVTTIGDGVFSGCTSLSNVKISNNITIIPNACFAYCTALTNLTLPNTITHIGSSAFLNYSGTWESLTLLSTVPPTLGNSVFSGPINNLTIYVPAESVDTYKAASGWSDYASKIQAIPT
jgi:hypothetical protein